jgi:transglutaminase-like putative cysteine protease
VSGRRRLGLVAACATLLASAPLASIFDTWTWLVRCIVAVGLIAGAALLARTLRAPTWAQAAGMAATLLLVLTWMYPSGDELLSLLPTPATIAGFGKLTAEAGADSRAYGVPVPDRDGLLFICVLGVGACAIVVDLVTVALRRPALAGLPMLAIYSVPVAVYVDDVPVLPFIVGTAGFLWLLVSDNIDRVRRFGRRFTGDGRDVDIWEPSPLASAGRRLAVVGVAAAVLVPLAVPGVTTGLLSRLTQTGAGVGQGGLGGGGGSGVSLFAHLSGSLSQTETVELARVKTTEAQPFYLRFGVADVVTDQGFANRAPSGRSISRLNTTVPPAAPGTSYRQYHADVQVSNALAMTLAPVYPSLVATNGLDGAWAYDPNMQVVFSNRTTTRGKKYSFDYVRPAFTPAALRTAAPLPPGHPVRTQFTAVPQDAAVASVVAGLVRGQRTDYDKVRAIYNYFSRDNGFSYSLSTQTGTSGSDIAAFLKNKVGFCQQYAAALAWMVRQAKIPARVAFGFTRGSSKDGSTYVLTNRNLHAWTEVYFDGFGWVPFDATPAASVLGSARSDWAPDVDRAPVAEPSSDAGVTAGDNASTAPGGRNADNRPELAGAAGGSVTPPSAGSSGGLLAAGIGALVIALLLVPALRRVLLRRRRHAATAPRRSTTAVADDGAAPGSREVVVTTEAVRARADAHAAWDELVDTMVDFRVPVDPAETPRHTAQRLVRDAALDGDAAGAATLLGRAEERARYARIPLAGEELTTALGRVRRALARAATRRTRLVAVLMPPSVMLRWRLALGDGAARLVAATGRRREAASRFSPRRLLAARPR